MWRERRIAGDSVGDCTTPVCQGLLLCARAVCRVHIFGHIHEVCTCAAATGVCAPCDPMCCALWLQSYGMTTNGVTTFINASNCTLKYKPSNPPIIIDVMPRRE